MRQKFMKVYYDYEDGLMDRREFLSMVAVIAGSTTAAYSLFPLFEDRHHDIC